jgi:hypothetical protein
MSDTLSGTLSDRRQYAAYAAYATAQPALSDLDAALHSLTVPASLAGVQLLCRVAVLAPRCLWHTCAITKAFRGLAACVTCLLCLLTPIARPFHVPARAASACPAIGCEGTHVGALDGDALCSLR